MSRAGVRVRLTALYGALFLLAGVLLLGVNYALVSRSLGDRLKPAGVAFPLPVTKEVAGPGELAPVDEASMKQALVAFERAIRDETLDRLVVQSMVALLVAVVVAVALGWLVAGRVLRPLHAMTSTARRLSSENLSERIALDGPDDELKELADTFDAMLDRLDGAFDSQRRFVANASHELRTPLAIQRTLLEVALADPAADLRGVASLLLATNERSERLLDGLLTLARSDRGLTTSAPFDLAEVVREVCDQHGAEARSLGVALDVSASPTTVRGDRVLVERLVTNLVQNALRHNVPGGTARVVADDGRLLVENTGPVVPEREVAGLFEPFRRYGADRVASDRGVGLGLSIVRSVAKAHGATLTATSRDGGGLVVTVAFEPA